MKQIPITTELLQNFRQNPLTLVFEGYCVNFNNVTVYNDGSNYALTAINLLGETECCIFSDDMSFVDGIVASLRGKIKFCGVSVKITDYLKSRYVFEWLTKCDLYVWNGKPLNSVCESDFIKTDIRPLDEKYAPQVSNGTPYHADLCDVRECLRKHPSAAVYVNGEPICWCLLHLEGSLGMLYTVPEYRRKGYALKVMTALTNMVIRAGNIPYAYIIEDNIASKSLAIKYNLQPFCKANYFEINLG